MHIGLNAQLLSLAPNYRSAGISGYIYHLLQALPQANVDGRHQYTAFTAERRWEPPPGMGVAWARWRTHRPFARIAWEQLVQPLSLASRHVDLIHSLAYVAPMAWPGPQVVTILDLSFILYPERFRPLNRLYLNLFTRLSARRADRVIAISESTRRDAVRLLRLDERKVEVVYCAADPTFRPQPVPEREAFRRNRELPDRFVLFLGTLEPRKNVIGLLEAYRLLRERWPGPDDELPSLVIAGARGWYYDAVYERAEQLQLGPHVRFVGYVPADELPSWYDAAELFVYPSLYEGFGLPVLEAMACGTAVVTSDRSSLPEVVGEAGLTVDPENVEQIAEAMLYVLREPDARQDLAARGRQRAARFTWERAASDTVAIYDRILNQGCC